VSTYEKNSTFLISDGRNNFSVYRVQVTILKSENLICAWHCLLISAFNCVPYKHLLVIVTDIYERKITKQKCNLRTFNYNSVITNITKGCDYDRHFVLHFCSLKTETRQKCVELATKAQITSVHSCNYECRGSNCRRNNFLPHSSKRGLNLKINFWTPTT